MAEIPNRAQLEASFGRQLAKLGADERKTLERLLGNPPNPANVPPEFWRDAQAKMQKKLAATLLLLFSASARHHGLDTEDMEAEAENFSTRQAEMLSRGFVSHSQRILYDSVPDWQETVAESKDGRVRRSQIRQRTLKIFGPSRMSVIATNETTRARHYGSEYAIEETVGLSDDDIWHTSPTESFPDGCPICHPLGGLRRERWAVLFPDGPPSPHVSCACWIGYARA